MAAIDGLATRQLGKSGPYVPRIGLGMMGASANYGEAAPDQERLAFLDEAYKRGETLWDTADEYGDSETLLGKWFAANPEKRKDIFLATKFAIRKAPGTQFGVRIDSSPEYCKEAIERSLTRLGLPYVDLYYIHRLTKEVPIENTIKAMVELKDAGKIKYLGLSECSAESLRRAHAVHPITAIQVEYSPFVLVIESPERKLLQTARELGVAVVCYSPLGSGILGGNIRTKEDVSEPGDLRHMLPWLNDENIAKNVAIVDKITELAKSKDATSAQLTLAWILSQGDDFFPIPGTTKVSRLDENLASICLSLSINEDNAIRKLAEEVSGPRFQDLTPFAFGDTVPL